jgi:shikimate dehydrogenase
MTAKAGVVGWPIEHSLSPVLHGYWLKEYGIDGEMLRVAARPEDFADTIARLRAEGFKGVNVTVPHKEAAFALADHNDDPALVVGASNLLVFHERGILGRNTDAFGLAETLRENIGTLDGKRVVLLGAGGAARGAVLALSMLGASTVCVLNRNLQRAEDFIQSLTDSSAPIKPAVLCLGYDAFPKAAAEAALLINTTSAGMGANPPLAIDLGALPKDAFVCDIVYSPLETPLLKDAAARGHKTIDGLGMLMHQAAPSFEAFFGKKPEITSGLRDALVKVLRER